MLNAVCFIMLSMSPVGWGGTEGNIVVNVANITSIIHSEWEGQMYTSINTNNRTENINVKETMEAIVEKVENECT